MSPTAPRWHCATCRTSHPSGQPCPVSQARKAAAKAAHDKARGTSTQRGYGSNWRIIRAAYLKAHPRCVVCGQPATDVDHIDGDNTHNQWTNLRAYCHRCHSARTGRDQAWGRKAR